MVNHGLPPFASLLEPHGSTQANYYQCAVMTNWKQIEDDPPKDGRPVLLWARLKSAPAERDAPSYPIVGRRDNWRWQATPDLLSSAALIPTYWTELPPEPDMSDGS
jgi:hypothetical protein